MTDLPDYDVHSQYLDLDGLRLHYVSEGPVDASPVVLLHGNPTWSFYYRKLIVGLRAHHRVIAPDYIGMGLSDKPDDAHYDYTWSRRVEDLTHLLESLAIRRGITLVMHDWGGAIGMAYAARFPERVSRLVLFNTAAFPLPKGKPVPWQLRVCRLPILGPLLVRGLNAFSVYAARECVTRGPMPPAVRRGYLAPYDSWRNRRAILRFVQDIPLLPGTRGYPTLKGVEEKLSLFAHKPALICWGMRDFVFDGLILDEWRKHLPSAEVHRFEDAGHYVLEDAAEEIVPLVARFLRAHADSPSEDVPGQRHAGPEA